MKKSLIALAVLGGFAGMASAQSTVTLYGSIDTGVEKVGGSATRVSSGVSKSNRLGFKGAEDLGGGLKASFVIETGFQSDVAGFESHSGLAGLGNRATWLSLGSKTLGTLSLGRGYTGNFFIQTAADPTGHKYGQSVDGTGTLMATNVNSRYDNTIRYESPNWYGFTADIGVGLQGDAQSDVRRPGVDAAPGSLTRNLANEGKAGYSAGFAYNNGPIYAGLGTTRTPGRSATGIAANSNAADSNVTIFAASYDLGIVKLGGSFEHDNRYRNRANSWMFAASAPLGSGKLMAFYGEDRNGGGTVNDSLKIAQVAYQYSLSKRTYVYAAFANESVNGRNAAGNQVGNSYNTVDGTSTQLGISHSF